MHQLEKEGQGGVADEKNCSSVKEFLNISEISQSIFIDETTEANKVDMCFFLKSKSKVYY